MRPLANARGVYGALCIMRSIEERRIFEDRLFAAEMTDPLTGLTNRRAFIAMLGHLVEEGSGGCLALFTIDNFKAINRRYGQAVGDEVLVVFSDLVRTLMRRDDIISRTGSDSLAVLLPGTSPEEARAICQPVIDTLTEVRRSGRGEGMFIIASGGVARIAGSLDEVLKRAEAALLFARANGRNRLELDPAAVWAPLRKAS
jgi:diguanylate cyclase (GGDEF)-like protein